MRPLEWWAGVYDHVFVALHPFVQVTGAGETTDQHAEHRLLRWSEAHERFGKGSYADFARCVFLLTCLGDVRGWSSLDADYADELDGWIDRSRLLKPEDDWLSTRLAPAYAECLGRCGVDSVVLVERPTYVEHRFAVSNLAEELASSSGQLKYGALYEDSRSIYMCGAMKMMDWTEALIAMTSEARDKARPEDLFEGFYATAETGTGWAGLGRPPGRYVFPGA